jgi:ABC-type nitrate/sulfonate/bicarbonate transport system permease component
VGIFWGVNVTAAPAARVGGRLPHERIRRWALPWIGVVSVLVLFELLSRSEIISSANFPPVTEWAQALRDVVGENGFWTAVGDTLQGWALGLAIAMAIAIPLGIVLGSSRLLYRSLRVVIEFLRPIPSVALIPLAVLVWGTGLSSKVFLAAFASTWPLLMQTLYGVQDVDPVATDTARSFGFGRVQRLVRVTLPSAVPYIATGVRISSSVALILVITAELVIGSPGLGREINLARQGGAVDLMYALIVVTGLLGWALNAVLAQVERRALHWHPSYRASEVAP